MALVKAYKLRKQFSSTKVGGSAGASLSGQPSSQEIEVQLSWAKPTMCHKVHGRSYENRLEISLNENGQPIGPDDDTVNEYTSFLGSVARKVNMLPLAVPSWKKFGKEKLDELWDYVVEISERNIKNRQAQKDKNIQHTAGPRSFARVKENLKKVKKMTRDPTPAEMFMETRKEKRTKRKEGEISEELKVSDSQSVRVDEVENVINSMYDAKDTKRRRLRLNGRGITSTQLKQKAIEEAAKKKRDEEVQAIKEDYEEKRRKDRAELANGLRSLITQIVKHNPDMTVDLGIFGSLLVEGQSANDAQSGNNSASMDIDNNQEEEFVDQDEDDDFV